MRIAGTARTARPRTRYGVGTTLPRLLHLRLQIAASNGTCLSFSGKLWLGIGLLLLLDVWLRISSREEELEIHYQRKLLEQYQTIPLHGVI
jgi:hypothetical protein